MEYFENLCCVNVLVNSFRIFVNVEVLQPSQPIGVMSSVVSLPNHTFFWAGCPLSG